MCTISGCDFACSLQYAMKSLHLTVCSQGGLRICAGNAPFSVRGKCKSRVACRLVLRGQCVPSLPHTIQRTHCLLFVVLHFSVMFYCIGVIAFEIMGRWCARCMRSMTTIGNTLTHRHICGAFIGLGACSICPRITDFDSRAVSSSALVHRKALQGIHRHRLPRSMNELF